jgi:hypothetical protein
MGPMAVRLTRNEIQLLKKLKAAGEHGQIVAAAPVFSTKGSDVREKRTWPRMELGPFFLANIALI